MSTEQKEGILIATISIVVLLILALLTEWGGYLGSKFDFSEASIRFAGFETSCKYEGPAESSGSTLYINDCGYSGTKYIFAFSLYFKTILIFALPIFSYGLLRAFGIVRRLFSFEEKLFKYVEEKRKL